ncbi:MAG TPA: creatininase family protein [Bacillota bacterium]|nr:creatininase family protein [Bacillota bacterium]
MNELGDSRYIPEMTSVAIRQAMAAGTRTAILALGSTEQHGHHAPLGTDSIIIEELGKRIAAKIDALLAPVVPLGFCPQHTTWAGSLNIRNETLALVLGEMADNLVGQGFEKFVFISGHGGNRTALDLAAQNLKMRHPAVQVLHAHLLAYQTGRALREKVQARMSNRPLSAIWEAHAGEQETALVMAVDPSLVHLDQAAPEPDVAAYLAKNRDPEVFRIFYDLPAVAPAGNWGDPRGATAEQGRIAYEEMASYLAAKILSKWD